MSDQVQSPDENSTSEHDIPQTTLTRESEEVVLGEASKRLTVSCDPPIVEGMSFSTGSPYILSDELLPEGATIGRYRVSKLLGQGGFGTVYAAEDEVLRRLVAVKVPHTVSFKSFVKEKEIYLKEARVLADLDHPHIVPVYDVGTTTSGLPFIVSKLISGCSLSERISQSRLSNRESVGLIIRIAEALTCAHDHKLVHRDVKPGNIVLENGTKPYLIDFGLVLREEDLGSVGGFSGSPAYMSPEQRNGEGHLVDGRSDIYSLGVVLYELIVGQLPHAGRVALAFLSKFASLSPIPPRAIDQSVPLELERIILKCLAHKASDRYATASELAEDLRHWLHPESNATKKDSAHAKIIPKGLRSFDAGDTDFFLQLLPGPHDREGLPESLRFWKTRIDETDPAKTFRVGVIYGPSGCGKSSFVKAGLLPRLADRVRVVYIEATSDESESRLLRSLERACPDLPKNGKLRDAIAFLRRGGDGRQKIVLVIDQFEQWLYGDHTVENAELVHALRQCDGERVQCIVMVRDDFWLALSRFMKALEIKLVEGQNAALTDLFDLAHARKVLSAFGRAYEVLPAEGLLSSEQEAFIAQAAEGLAQDEKVISVRIALFAEMMKGRAWTPVTLAQMGGTDGIGVTFLEKTFSSRSAPPEHRKLQEAARGVLRALLPGSGTDIKGHMRSLFELREAAGFGERPKEFEDLLAILDGELRLITPTEAEGEESAASAERYYQLTHDFLVSSLRDWLTRKQKETKKGRAELLLEDSCGVWNARPENRQLPTLLQWVHIRRLVPKRSWTAPQAKMMAKAARLHALRSVALAGLLAAFTFAGLVIRDQVEEKRKATHAEGLVQAVLGADTSLVPGIISRMSEYRHWTNPLLRDEIAKAITNSKPKLHASLALLPVDATQVDFLYSRLLDAAPQDMPVLRDALAPHKVDLLEQLWAVVEKPEKGQESQRLRAAAALAKYDPESVRWEKAGATVVDDLVLENLVYLGHWSESFGDVKNKLIPRLKAIYRDQQPERSAERSLATNLLANYCSEKPEDLAELLMDADVKQFAVIYPKFKDRGALGLPILLAEIAKSLPKEMPSSDNKREILAKRQANAAVALLRMNKPETVWPMLKHSHDPRVRSYIIHKLSPLGGDAKAILKQLDEEKDITIRRALLLGLGEFSESELTIADRQSFLPKLQAMYLTSPDPGLHSASEWLLRKWEERKWLEPGWLKKINDEWARDKARHAIRLEEIKTSLRKKKAPPQWYVNTQGQTMVVLPGPMEFQMGSPTTERGRFEGPSSAKEDLVNRTIGRSFAIANKLVTVEEFRTFRENHGNNKLHSPSSRHPVNSVTWYDAVEYCNWLSEQEGLTPVYERNKANNYSEGMRLKINHLELDGYRLPTESEWEYACRAESVTSRHYGETEELLENYSWYIKNSQGRFTLEVGSLKPNDYGLFDLHGNSLQWCEDKVLLKYKPGADQEDSADIKSIIDKHNRILRGASFFDPASTTRSASRSQDGPAAPYDTFGFRPARTIVP